MQTLAPGAAIRLGIDEPTGSFSVDEENLGFRVAYREANAAGGVHGRPITWIGYPRQITDAEGSLAVVRRLVEEDQVFALMNFSGVVTEPASRVAEARHVPLLFPHSGMISSAGRRYLFTSLPAYAGEARLMFRYLARDRGLRRLGIVHDENAYGRLFLNLLREHAAANGYAVVGQEPVHTRNPAALDAELARLAAAGADGIVMALYPAQAQALMRARAARAWPGRMISVGPLTDESCLVVPGSDADGTLGFCYYPDPADATSGLPGIGGYRAALARFAPDHAFNRYSLYGYTFGRLVLEGLRRTGETLDRERFIDAMEGIQAWDSGGVMPPTSFGPQNHHAQSAGMICELRAGRFRPLTGWIQP